MIRVLLKEALAVMLTILVMLGAFCAIYEVAHLVVYGRLAPWQG